LFIRDPDPDFITHSGSGGKKGTGSRIRIRNTVYNTQKHTVVIPTLGSSKHRAGGLSFLRYYSDPLGSGPLHPKPTSGLSPQSAPPVIFHTAPPSSTAATSSTTTVGYYMDNGQVVAVTNPDYNVEKTVVISSGKQQLPQQQQQQEQGLNLSYRHHHRRHSPHHHGPDSRYLLARTQAAAFRSRPQLDLSEWVGHRVLARCGNVPGVYYPGIIAEVRPLPDNDLHILLDRTNESIVVKLPLADGQFDAPAVISDAIPMTSQVEIGSKVCVRQPRSGRGLDTFVEAVVYEVCRQPLQFLVKMGESEEEDSPKIWVTRAALRLQEPPWLEELAAVADYPQETVRLRMGSKPLRHQSLNVVFTGVFVLGWCSNFVVSIFGQ
jgi:hypothetical protein